jgi:hypothetical protein
VPKEAFDQVIDSVFGWGHVAMESTAAGCRLTREEFPGGWTTEELVRLFFVESDVRRRSTSSR